MSVQQFKLHVANTVVTKDNQSLSSMDTAGLVELFVGDDDENESKHKLTSEPVLDAMGKIIASTKSSSSSSSSTSSIKAVLQELQELSDGSEYREEFDVDTFMRSMQQRRRQQQQQ